MKIDTIAYTLMTKIKNFVLLRSQKPLNEATQSRKLYQDLSIPFNKFIEILVNNDYSQLIVSGDFSLNELLNQWEIIYNQFIEAIGNDEVKIRLETVKEITEIENRIKIADSIIRTLKVSYSDELAHLLTEFGYSLNIKPNENNIDRVIKIFMGFVNADILALNNKIAEMPANENESETPTRQYFEKMIVSIELAFKVSINIDNISTGKYCEYVNNYNVWVKKVLTKKTIE